MLTLPPIASEQLAANLVTFIQNQCKQADIKNLVIGLSGGIDSAVVATLAVRAVGSQQLFAYFLPYGTLHDEHRTDLQTLSQQLKIEIDTIDIAPQVDPYFLSQQISDPVRRGNKMARERMSILFDQAKAHKALVIGTSNKTEALLGYGTLFGDTAWSFCPITDLYKTYVRQLAQHLELPPAFITKPPSAGLWAGQTDEDELGYTYDELDRFLYAREDLGKTPAELAELGFPPTMITTVSERVEQNRFKSRLGESWKMFS